MSLPQQKFREIVFQLLYSHDLGKPKNEDMIELIMHELSVTRRAVAMAQQHMHDILAKQEELDAFIAKTSVSYNFDRIQTVERNVLRLGLYEMLFDDTIPPKVAMAEAMRLARKFSTPESASFINAVMDHLYKINQGEETDAEGLQKSVQSLVESEAVAKEAAQNKQKEISDGSHS